MTELLVRSKALTVNPLKVGQSVGAALAFLGLARCMPLHHGARGCTSFSKLFLMRHFREPIALQTTAMEAATAILGADDNGIEALRTVAERNAPDIIGLITTGLSEMQGADILRMLKEFRAAHPRHAALAVVPVAAPDTEGCLETGFARAVEAIAAALLPQVRPPRRQSRQVNLLASPMHTVGDLEAIKEWIEAFGLRPVCLPDLADSLDGHLIAEGFSTLTYGGTPRADVASMGESVATLVVGPSLDRAADFLRQRTGVPDWRFAGLMGLQACDAFVQVLSEISGRPIPGTIERQRSQLLDAMLDCHAFLDAVPVAVAADPDLLQALCELLVGAGANVTVAVAPIAAAHLRELPIAEVVVGDLEDFEQLSRERQVDLLIANSHGAEIAARLSVPLLRAGLPLYDLIGGHARTWVGYRGSRQTLFDIANLMARHWKEIAPYRSIYWTGTPRASEVVR